MICGTAVGLVDQHQLGRAAADVEDQRRAVAGLEQEVAAEHGEPRFLLRRDDVEHDAGLAPHPLDEIAAVDGAAAGLGRDRARRARRCGASASRRRPRARATARSIASCAERPVCARPSPSRTTREKASMTVKPLVGRARDQQAAIVGAEVDRAIGVAMGGRRSDGFRGPPCSAGSCRSVGRRTGGCLRHEHAVSTCTGPKRAG